MCPGQTYTVTVFSSTKLYQRRISHLQVVMKKIYNFLEKSELPNLILAVKINWLILFCGFRAGNKKFAEIRPGSLSRLAASPLDFALPATPRVLAPTWACSQAHVHRSISRSRLRRALLFKREPTRRLAVNAWKILESHRFILWRKGNYKLKIRAISAKWGVSSIYIESEARRPHG